MSATSGAAPPAISKQAPGSTSRRAHASAQHSFCGLDHFAAALAFFDTRRGQREGQEHDKVLAFFPSAAVPDDTQTSIVGLAQALNGFCATFQPEDDTANDASQPEQQACMIFEAQHNTWLLQEVEPCIWAMLVVSHSWLGAHTAHAGLRSFLTTLYDVAVLLHGPLQALGEGALGLGRVRGALQPLLDEAGRLLLGPGPRVKLATAPHPLSRDGASLINPFGLHHGIPLLTVPAAPFLGVQSLCGQLENVVVTDCEPELSFAGEPRTPVGPGTHVSPSEEPHHPVTGVQVSWNGLPLWTSLGPRDSRALHSLTQRALLPAAGIRRKKGGTLKAALVAAAAATTSAVLPSTVGSPGAPPGSGPHVGVLDNRPATLMNPSRWTVTQTTGAGLGAGTPGGILRPSPFVSQPAGVGAATPAGEGASIRPAQGAGGAGPGATGVAGTLANTAAAFTAGLVGTGSVASAPGALPGALDSARLTGWVVPAPEGLGGNADDSSTPGGEGLVPVRVWSADTQRYMQLLVYHHGPLLVCVLLASTCAPTHDHWPHVVSELAKVLHAHAAPLATQLHDSLGPAATLWHTQGYRYSHKDLQAGCTRATPAKKVTTLSDGTLRLAAHARNKLAEWAAVQALPEGDGEPFESEDHAWDEDDSYAELVCRTALDGWVVVRHAGCQRLTVACEQVPLPTLTGTSAHVDKLCDALQLPGSFAGFV